MDAQTFWFYSAASACFVWGVLGTRFALSVLLANAVLAFLLFVLAESIGNSNLLYALMFCYPLYWGLAFAGLSFFVPQGLPAFAVSLRLGLGCFLALVFILCSHSNALLHSATLLQITYLSEPKQRPAALKAFFQNSSEEQVCRNSYATLMRLALNARDKETLSVLLQSFSPCRGAASTLSEVVKPLIDNNALGEVQFLLECGLSPATEVFGHEYANGTALAYAAAVARKPEIARAIFVADPEKARNMKSFSILMDTLRAQGNEEMLSLFSEQGAP